MNKLVWTKSSMSGLCDRLLDLHLVAAFAKVLNRQLFLEWNVQTQLTTHQLKTWPKIRFEDYKKENFTQYFNLADNINIVDNVENEKGGGAIIFNQYVGGIHSPNSFHDAYCLKYCKLEEFVAAFRSVVSQFTPKDKLLNLTGEVAEIDIAVHLRRGDKICENPDEVQIHNCGLDELNDLTGKCFEAELKRLNLPRVFICSDEEVHKTEFKNRFGSSCGFIEVSNPNIDYEQTYIDMYLLSKSKTIIMSQKHSNFSLFCSLINQNRLIYFYPDNQMFKRGGLPNCKLYQQ